MLVGSHGNSCATPPLNARVINNSRWREPRGELVPVCAGIASAEARRDGLSGCRSPTPTCARQAGHLAKRHSAASLSGHACLEPHPPHAATTPTTAKAGLHSPRHDHLAGQSRVKTPPPRPLPRREVAVGMSYSLLWPPSEPTFSQTGSLGNVGGNRIPAMAQCHRTTFGQAPECTTYVLLYNDLTPPCA